MANMLVDSDADSPGFTRVHGHHEILRGARTPGQFEESIVPALVPLPSGHRCRILGYDARESGGDTIRNSAYK